MENGAKLNTDIEIYRRPNEKGEVDYYNPILSITKSGALQICVGGTCISRTIEAWFKGDDGYHTHEELYDHRCLLFLLAVNKGLFADVFVVEDHFDGWDLIVAHSPSIQHEQISYHVPTKYRKLLKGLERKDSNPDFDGHTSRDVLERLESLIRS